MKSLFNGMELEYFNREQTVKCWWKVGMEGALRLRSHHLIILGEGGLRSECAKMLHEGILVAVLKYVSEKLARKEEKSRIKVI